MAKKIFIVEDESIVSMEVQDRLSGLGYEICGEAASGEEAIEKVFEALPDLVLMDVRLAGQMDGIQAAEVIRSHYDLPVVYLTAFSDEATLKRAKITDPFGYLLKPFDERTLHATIEMAMYRHEMEKKLRANEEFLAVTLKSIGDAVIATDAEGHITFMNPLAEKITGWRQDKVLGDKLNLVVRLIGESTELPAANPIEQALRQGEIVTASNNTLLLTKSDQQVPIDTNAAPIKDDKGAIIGGVLAFRDITARREQEKEKEKLIDDLQNALKEVKALSGLLPICASCKKIRDDQGYWNQIEAYIQEHSEAKFSHGICPECKLKLYPEFAEKKMKIA